MSVSVKEKKKMPKVLKVFLWIIGSIAGLFLIVWGGFNILKYPIYSEFYSIKSDLCTIPGLNDDFIPQGITASEENDVYIVSGYMKDKSNSRIYITNKKNQSRYIKLTKNGEKFNGHCGGIATTGNNIYIANGSRIYTIALDAILEKDTKTIDVGEGIKVNNSASFVFTNDNYLYVGEFHDGGKYVTKHIYETSEGTHSAIVSKYALNDLSKPLEIYSVRNKVQGFAVTDDGRFVLSTSYGLDSSHIYVYNSDCLVDANQTLDDAPVYYLVNHTKDLFCPAMSEDLDVSNGKVITLTESACNKYIFGKFFFATKAWSLSL